MFFRESFCGIKMIICVTFIIDDWKKVTTKITERR